MAHLRKSLAVQRRRMISYALQDRSRTDTGDMDDGGMDNPATSQPDSATAESYPTAAPETSADNPVACETGGTYGRRTWVSPLRVRVDSHERLNAAFLMI